MRFATSSRVNCQLIILDGANAIFFPLILDGDEWYGLSCQQGHNVGGVSVRDAVARQRVHDGPMYRFAVRKVCGAAFGLGLFSRLFSQALALRVLGLPAPCLNRGLLLALGAFDGFQPLALGLLGGQFQFQFAALGGFALFLCLALGLGLFACGLFLGVTAGLLGGGFGNLAVALFLFALGGFGAEPGEFGLFGFVLQRGGLGNGCRLTGQLRFKDWTVFNVMFTAILVAIALSLPLIQNKLKGRKVA